MAQPDRSDGDMTSWTALQTASLVSTQAVSAVEVVDAPLVEHLRAAGAVMLGRTNTPEFSWRWHTDNPLFGATLNPWAPVDLAGMYTLLARRATQLRAWQQLLTEDVDVVVLPVAMEPAWPAGDGAISLMRLEQIFAANTPLVAFNFLGLPAVAQPTGIVGGRPVGVQIIARRFAEHVALDAAEAIESVLGRFCPPR